MVALEKFDKFEQPKNDLANAPQGQVTENSVRAEGMWNNSDLFGSPSDVTTPKRPAAESMSRTPSVDAYIKRYRDVPSLSTIRDRMGSLGSARQHLRSEADNLNGISTPIKEELVIPKDELPAPDLFTPSKTEKAENVELVDHVDTEASTSAFTPSPAMTGPKQ